jgi:hypothetical protein
MRGILRDGHATTQATRASNVAVVPLLRNKNGGGTLILKKKNNKKKRRSYYAYHPISPYNYEID